MYYFQMDIWFGNQSSGSEEFDRAAKLKAALFDFFADHSKTPPVMNYISMVSLSFSCLINGYEKLFGIKNKNVYACSSLVPSKTIDCLYIMLFFKYSLILFA